ncbi:ABC transporter permease [Dokdonella sp.]|uniref:ABC transporter permease n=1 Tax=Dokdonella sp. TaxID=2291710 RepID=UPI0031C506AE|nr:ABC transporter permease subunit [Dokdonella sp.]
MSASSLALHRIGVQRTSRAWALAGIALIVLAWQFAASRLGPLLMTTPLETLAALIALVQRADFQRHAGTSLLRIALGAGGGCLIGLLLGLAAGASARLRGLLEPLRWLLMAVPPVIVVVLAMLWFGLGTEMVVFMAMLMLAPGMYVNTVKGMQAVDRQLAEMTHVYRFTLFQRLRHLYLPTLAAPLTAALLIATCGSVRLVVMAEVLGAADGAGFALANARSTFDSGELYAWTLLTLLLVGVLELALLQPLQRRLARWQEQVDA